MVTHTLSLRSPASQRALRYAIVLGLLSLSLACNGEDEDPIPGMTSGIVIGPGGEDAPAGTPAGDMGGETGGVMGGDTGGDPVDPPGGDVPPVPGGETGGGEVMVECTEVGPDLDMLASEVGPSLILNCATCHAPNGFADPKFPIDPATLENPIQEPLLTEMYEVMSGYITPGEPSQSSLFVKGTTSHSGSSELPAADADALEAWIDAFVYCEEIVVEPPMGGEPVGGEPMGGAPMGGEPVDPGSTFCDLLPNGDPQNRANGQYYDLFESNVNDSLQLSCASRNGCHATPDYGFWLQPSSDPCSVQANFLMIQAYINFANADDSPVLKAPYDPEHSGYMIYTGRSDLRFVELRNWILLAFGD